MNLEIRLFAGLTCKNDGLPCFGLSEFDMDAPEQLTVGGLHELLRLAHLALVTVVNGVVEKKDFVLSHGNRVAIFPPIAGGGPLAEHQLPLKVF